VPFRAVVAEDALGPTVAAVKRTGHTSPSCASPWNVAPSLFALLYIFRIAVAVRFAEGTRVPTGDVKGAGHAAPSRNRRQPWNAEPCRFAS